MKRFLYFLPILACLTGCGQKTVIDLPRHPSPEIAAAVEHLLHDAAGSNLEIHSIMVVKDGQVAAETWLGDAAPDKPHILHSVSKTFTATTVGLAISEGRLALEDKLVDFFPEQLPDTVSDNLARVTVRDLLTMNCGHDTEPSNVRRQDGDWVTGFLAWPVTHEPGTFYCYNSLGTYMLSAIVQKVTGEKVVDYLTPRLFEPLHIDKPEWQESPQGINTGGWGLYLKTEDLAKMGQLFLQGGKWNGRQVIPAEWVTEASKFQVPSVPSGVRPEQAAEIGLTAETSDWVQGYGYQMWRCRHNAYRADGANGQYILVLPEQNAVVAVTAGLNDMQAELNLIWDHLLPVL